MVYKYFYWYIYLFWLFVIDCGSLSPPYRNKQLNKSKEACDLGCVSSQWRSLFSHDALCAHWKQRVKWSHERYRKILNIKRVLLFVKFISASAFLFFCCFILYSPLNTWQAASEPKKESYSCILSAIEWKKSFRSSGRCWILYYIWILDLIQEIHVSITFHTRVHSLPENYMYTSHMGTINFYLSNIFV